ncbi:MAG TPA: LCP family protein [Deinococcales bacterium]|nr:LCP family protein [Deinococcales bacterium]
MKWIRAAQVGGLVLAILALISYALISAPARNRVAAPDISTPVGKAPSFSIVLAGRDLEYCGYHTLCTGAAKWGSRTDTILYAKFQEGRVDVISIPRDTWVGGDYYAENKVNAAFGLGGAEGLKSAVEKLIGENIDFYAVVNMDFVARFVEALGGVDVYLPEPMDYDDTAANLHIHFPAGNVHLDGKTVVGYLRFRHGFGSDYSRMDRGKDVISKLLEKAKGPAILRALPTLIPGLLSDVQTNMTLSQLQQVVPFVRHVTPRFATLPTTEGYSTFLIPDQAAIAKLMASMTATPNAAPDLSALNSTPYTILNASGVNGLGRALADYLVTRGFPRAAAVETAPTQDEQSQVERNPLAAADGLIPNSDVYAQLLGLRVSAPYRYPDVKTDLVIVLGRDAATRYAALAARAATPTSGGPTAGLPANGTAAAGLPAPAGAAVNAPTAPATGSP